MMPGLPDLQSLLQQAQQMQADMARAQSDLAQVEVTGHAGGGLVSATVTGDGHLKALDIDPSVVDPADVETLADLIVAAVRDASRSAAELAGQSLGSVAGLGGPGGLGGPAGFDLSAFGLPSLDGLLDDDDQDDYLDDETDDDEGDQGDDDDDDEDDLVPAGLAGPIDVDELNDVVDAGVVDAGVVDAGVVDAGVVDAADAEPADGPAGEGPDAAARRPSGA